MPFGPRGTVRPESNAGFGLHDPQTGARMFLPDETPEQITAFESLKAAFFTENPIASAVHNFGKGSDTQTPGYNPFDPEQYDLSGYEDVQEAFTFSDSAEESDSIKRKIDEQRIMRQRLEQDGFRGFAFMMAAGMLSPENLIPIGTAITSFKIGESILKGFGRSAAAGFGASAISETILHANQPVRTKTESAFNITGATLLSGILGSAASGAKVKKFHKLAEQLDVDLKAQPFDTSVGAMKAALKRRELLPKTAFGRNRDIQIGALEKELDNASPKRQLEINKEIKDLKKVDVDLFEFVNIGPGARLEVSPMKEAIRIGRELESNPSRIRANIEGIESPQAVEDFIKLWDGTLGEAILKHDSLYYTYRTGTAKSNILQRKLVGVRGIFDRKRHLSRKEFNEEVGEAMSNGDVHEIPEIQQAARAWRKQFYDPMLEASKEAGILPKDFQFDNITATSYVNRAYNTQKIRAEITEFQNELVDWLKKGGSREAELERLVKQVRDEADPKKVDKLREKIEKLEKSEVRLKELSDSEAKEIAREIIDGIMKTPGGVVSPGNMKAMGKATPFHARALLMPDKMLAKWLHRDIEYLALRMRRHVVPEIELTKKFGDPSMKIQLDDIKREADRLMEKAKPGKETDKIGKARDQAITDIKGIRDRLLGVYRMPENPESIAYRASYLTRQWNFVTHMGQMMLASVPDIGKMTMVLGLKRNAVALKQMASSPKVFRMRMKILRSWGVGTDMALHTRAHSLMEIGDPWNRLSRFEEGSKYASETFGFVALMDPWNAVMKQIAGVQVEDRIIDVAISWTRGTAKKGDIEALASAGINKDMARRIAKSVLDNGEMVDGVRIARVDKWADKELARSFKAAVVKDVDNVIVTRGAGDVPLLLSSEVGKHLVQFKSFGIATVRRTLQSGLQQRDMATMNGLMIMMALGGLTYVNKALLSGREITSDPEEFVGEAFDHSGIMGFLWEGPMMLNRSLGGGLFDDGLSRYRTRPQFGALLGPTFGTGERLFKLGNGALKGDVSDADIHAMRRLIPYQNLFYLRWLFDQMEDELDS